MSDTEDDEGPIARYEARVAAVDAGNAAVAAMADPDWRKAMEAMKESAYERGKRAFRGWVHSGSDSRPLFRAPSTSGRPLTREEERILAYEWEKGMREAGPYAGKAAVERARRLRNLTEARRRR